MRTCDKTLYKGNGETPRCNKFTKLCFNEYSDKKSKKKELIYIPKRPCMKN